MTDQQEPVETTPDEIISNVRKLQGERIEVARKGGYLKGVKDASARLEEVKRDGYDQGFAAGKDSANQDLSLLYEAHAAAMEDVEDLDAQERNPSGGGKGYAYASIDQFLKMMRKALHKHGLSVRVGTKGWEVTDRMVNNKLRAMLSINFEFTLRHKSGQSDTPVIIPQEVDYFGAQSFGSARSYAYKQFLRSAFNIATGDKDDPDGIAHPEGRDPNADAKTKAQAPKKPTKAAVTAAIKQLDEAKTEQEVTAIFGAMDVALRDHPEVLKYSTERIASFNTQNADAPAGDQEAEQSADGQAQDNSDEQKPPANESEEDRIV